MGSVTLGLAKGQMKLGLKTPTELGILSKWMDGLIFQILIHSGQLRQLRLFDTLK